MNEKQEMMWDILVELDGETVAQLLTDWHGLQLLDDGFYEHLIEEGYIDEPEEDDEDEDEEDNNMSDNKAKALAFIRQLKLHPNVERELREDDIVNVSEGPDAILFWSEDEQDETIDTLQEEDNVVWHIVKGTYILGGEDKCVMEAYLLATNEDSYEVCNPSADSDEIEAFAFVKNLTWPDCSEYGYVRVQMKNGGLVRTA